MPNRLVLSLLCAAALAYACGPWGHSSPHPAAIAAHTRARGDSGVTSAFDVLVNQHERGHVSFALRVANNGRKQIELRFPTGQTHEFAVVDTLGRPVWRWSEGRMFTSALQNKLVKPKDTVTYEDTWDAQRYHGTFVAVAQLTSDNHPVEQRVTFTLR